MDKIFSHGGYDFWRDRETGRWNVVRQGAPAPSHCAYATPKAIADLKGLDLRNVVGLTV